MWNSAFLPDLVLTQHKKWSVFSSLMVCDDLRHSDCGLTHNRITPMMICNIMALPIMWYCLINGSERGTKETWRKDGGWEIWGKKGAELTACRTFLEERLTIFLFIAHSSSHSKMAFWRQTQTVVLQLHSLKNWHTKLPLGRETLWKQTLKYMGAISPSSRGSGIHSSTMCRRWRGLMCVSINTQSRSWDSNIRTRAPRNSWGQQSSTEGNPNLTQKNPLSQLWVYLNFSVT